MVWNSMRIISHCTMFTFISVPNLQFLDLSGLSRSFPILIWKHLLAYLFVQNVFAKIKKKLYFEKTKSLSTEFFIGYICILNWIIIMSQWEIFENWRWFLSGDHKICLKLQQKYIPRMKSEPKDVLSHRTVHT